MNQPQTMIHLSTDVLPTALIHLRKVGCDSIDPFTLALTAWQGDPVESLETASERQRFQGLHLAACKLLDVQPCAPDLRSLDQRNNDSIRALRDAYRWAGKAQISHAPALEAYASQRKQG